MGIKNFFVGSAKQKAKHEQTPLDIYFSSLEEAYGNLPVPSDDWAGVRVALSENWKDYEVEEHMARLGDAIDVIREHYIKVAEVLKKEQLKKEQLREKLLAKLYVKLHVKLLAKLLAKLLQNVEKQLLERAKLENLQREKPPLVAEKRLPL